MTKKYLIACAVSALALTQAGCATHIETLPIAPVAATTSQDVALYFGTQTHPPVQHRLGGNSFSVRIARTTKGPEDSCNEALKQALDKLVADARAVHANAVINVTTRFHDNDSSSPTQYTCGLSTSAAAIAVQGERVVLQK